MVEAPPPVPALTTTQAGTEGCAPSPATGFFADRRTSTTADSTAYDSAGLTLALSGHRRTSAAANRTPHYSTRCAAHRIS